jgi:hypothetical protein
MNWWLQHSRPAFECHASRFEESGHVPCCSLVCTPTSRFRDVCLEWLRRMFVVPLRASVVTPILRVKQSPRHGAAARELRAARDKSTRLDCWLRKRRHARARLSVGRQPLRRLSGRAARRRLRSTCNLARRCQHELRSGRQDHTSVCPPPLTWRTPVRTHPVGSRRDAAPAYT